MDQLAHYYLILALVEDKSFIVNKYYHYIYWVCGYYNGNYYIAKSPGLSFLGIPIYIASKYLSNYILFFKEYQFILTSFVAFLSSLTAVLIYDMCKLFKCKERTAIITSLLYAFGTIAWTDSKLFEDGSVSPFFIVLGIYLLIRTAKTKDMTRIKEYTYISLAGVTLGYSVLIEYSNFFIVLPGIIYMFYFQRTSLRVKRSFIMFILPFLTCISTIFLLNWIIYGSPFENAYNYHITGGTMHFSITNIPTSSFSMLLYSTEGAGSLFFYQPLIFFTSSYGMVQMYRRFKGEALLFVISILSNLLFYSLREASVNQNHHIGPTYMPPVMPLIVIFTAFTIEYISAQNVPKSTKWIFWCIFIGLFSFSIVVIGICVLTYNIVLLTEPIAYIKGFELLRSGYLDPRLLKHRFLPFIFIGIILFILFWDRMGALRNLLERVIYTMKKRGGFSEP